MSKKKKAAEEVNLRDYVICFEDRETGFKVSEFDSIETAKMFRLGYIAATNNFESVDAKTSSRKYLITLVNFNNPDDSLVYVGEAE